MSDCRGETTNKQSGEPRRRVGPRGGGAGGRVTHRATSATETTYLTSMTHSVCMCVCVAFPRVALLLFIFFRLFFIPLSFSFLLFNHFFLFRLSCTGPIWRDFVPSTATTFKNWKWWNAFFSRNFITKLKMFSKNWNAQFKQAKCQSKYFFWKTFFEISSTPRGEIIGGEREGGTGQTGEQIPEMFGTCLAWRGQKNSFVSANYSWGCKFCVYSSHVHSASLQQFVSNCWHT